MHLSLFVYQKCAFLPKFYQPLEILPSPSKAHPPLQKQHPANVLSQPLLFGILNLFVGVNCSVSFGAISAK
jgi:hypothetical protein